MKKFASIIMAGIMCLSMAACGGKTTTEPENAGTTETAKCCTGKPATSSAARQKTACSTCRTTQEPISLTNSSIFKSGALYLFT